jgi:HD-GYP domain-containing protein (c-di-GMP phosphodiesterase class II)
MNQPHGKAAREGANVLREQGLQIVTRLVATLRTGRSYSIGNQVFTRQLEQLLETLQPVMAEHGEAMIVAIEGDLHVNGVRLPLRSSSLRFLEQMAQEFQVREIAGVEFRAGLALPELEGFMRFFMPSELYKGTELYHACATQSFQHVMPVESAVAESMDEGTEAGAETPELSQALHAYARALQNAQLLLGDGMWRRGLELRHLKRITQPLADAAMSEFSGTASMAGLPRASTSVWEHSVHVCVLTVAIGRHLGLDKAALAELGVAALLHDAGKPAVAPRVHHPFAGRGPAERAEAESHTLEGLRAIAMSTTLNSTTLAAMRAALEHHAGEPGGYPAFSAGWTPALSSRIVGLADAFISQLDHPKEGRGPLTPYEALGRVLGPLAQHFHPGLRAALVRAIGVYPPGQVVELDDGSLARSLGSASVDPERPLVEWLVRAGGETVAAGQEPPCMLPADRIVRRALPLAEWPAHVRAA